jgi:CheY-like chemotaxis protein
MNDRISADARRILVVDENAVDRIGAEALLADLGYGADTAVDGTHAAELAMRRRYGLALVGTGSSGGMEVVRHIRALGGWAGRMPILALGPKLSPDLVDADRSAGFDGRISLPLDPAELMSRMVEWLGPPESRRQASDDSSRPVGAVALIDRDRLERVRGDVGDDMFPVVLASYLRGGRARLARIESLLADNQLVPLTREAHDLRGASATFGAPRLGHLAQDLERAGKARDLAAAEAAFQPLRLAAEATWPLFEAELSTAETSKPRAARARSSECGRP